MTRTSLPLCVSVLALVIGGSACFEDPVSTMSSGETAGDGDGDPSGDGDGDGSGDGDGDASGDGDGEPATGDGDGDPASGDGDGDSTSGDGDGDATGDGDGDLPEPMCGDGVPVPGEICYGEVQLIAASDVAYSAHYGAVNDDGNLDIVYLLGDGTVVYHIGDGGGAFAGATDMSLTIGGGPMLATTFDANDEHVDLITAYFDEVEVVLGNGSGGFGQSALGVQPSAITAFALGQVDGDDDLDVVSAAGGDLRIDLNNGSGAFIDPPGLADAGLVSITALGVADFTGDGLGDVALGSDSGITVRRTDGQTVMFGDNFPTGIGANITALAVGDINGDENPDLAYVDNSTNNIGWVRGAGAGAFIGVVDRSLPGGPRSLVLADFDNDGFDDLAVGLDDMRVVMMLSDGMGEMGDIVEIPLGISARELFADGDANGDGVLDLIVTDTNNESVVPILSTP